MVEEKKGLNREELDRLHELQFIHPGNVTVESKAEQDALEERERLYGHI